MSNQSGLQQYGIDQAGIDAALEKWFYEQYAPYNMLSQYQSWVTGPYGASADRGTTGGNALTPQGQGGAVGPGGQPWTGPGTISVKGRAAQNSPWDPMGIALSGTQRRFGGVIDPYAGTVNVNPNKKNPGKKDAWRDAQATQYLQTGQGAEGRKFKRIRSAADDLRGQGWTWNPNTSVGNVLVGG